MIRKISILASVIIAAMMFSACSKQVTPTVEYLEVNANNISGNWKLDKWNGSDMASGTYMYVKFVRNGTTFDMWQNMDSFSNIPHYSFGNFNILIDEERGAYIIGEYLPQDTGFWKHNYLVKDLTKDTMTWVAMDDENFVQHFVRVDSIPYEESKK